MHQAKASKTSRLLFGTGSMPRAMVATAEATLIESFCCLSPHDSVANHSASMQVALMQSCDKAARRQGEAPSESPELQVTLA